MQWPHLGCFTVASFILGVVCRMNFGKESKQYCECFYLVFLCDRYSTQSQSTPKKHSKHSTLPPTHSHTAPETQIHTDASSMRKDTQSYYDMDTKSPPPPPVIRDKEVNESAC